MKKWQIKFFFLGILLPGILFAIIVADLTVEQKSELKEWVGEKVGRVLP